MRLIANPTPCWWDWNDIPCCGLFLPIEGNKVVAMERWATFVSNLWHRCRSHCRGDDLAGSPIN